MKKFILFGLISLSLLNTYAKKDPQAWKAEKQLESQFVNFKSNSSYWNGFLMFKEPRLNEFHQVIMDTIVGLEKKIVTSNGEINKLNNEITALTKELSSTQTNLTESLSKEDALVTLGIPFNKNVFPPIMYGIILLLAGVAVVAFLLFFRSNTVTKGTKKLYNELLEDFDLQKKKAFDRETKLNRELQTERNKNS